MGMLDVFLQSPSSVSLFGSLVVLLIIFLISYSFSSQGHSRGPPGPTPLPLLGNLLQLDLERIDNSLLELSKKYGSVFTVYLGPKKVVVLAGYKTVKEALLNYGDEFGGRSQTLIFHEIQQGQGILWANGDSWKVMRRFALSTLRTFGMGKKACEDKITEECHHLTEVLRGFKGEAFDAARPIYNAVSNVICCMVYGSRFEYDDSEFTYLVDQNRRHGQLSASPSIQMYNIFPWFCKWIANRREIHQLSVGSLKQTTELVSRLKETLNPQKCRGFVDAFLVRKKNLEESGIMKSNFHDENLLRSIMNLFSAGSDTTASTLRWGLLFMAKYPKIQDQVQEELKRVIGSRQVQVEDRKNLPITNAVIHETQRLANITPIALPRKTTEDVTFQGHFIKKGTTVITLLMSVLYDESEWESPYTFYPAHFLDKNGMFVKPDAFMPFSAGHRICLGESLAKMELFILFTTLLQQFRFTPPPGVLEDELDLTPRMCFTLEPLPHKLCAVPRM